MAEESVVRLPLDESQWTYWWQVNIGSGNCLVPSGSKPLPVLMLTQTYVVIWCHWAQRVLKHPHPYLKYTGTTILAQSSSQLQRLDLKIRRHDSSRSNGHQVDMRYSEHISLDHQWNASTGLDYNVRCRCPGVKIRNRTSRITTLITQMTNHLLPPRRTKQCSGAVRKPVIPGLLCY